MHSRNCENNILDGLAHLFEGEGYIRNLAAKGFVRSNGNVRSSVELNLIRSSKSRVFHFDFYLSVWHGEVESLINHARLQAGLKKQNLPTACKLMVNLFPKTDKYDWSFLRIEEIDLLLPDVKNRLSKTGLSFLRAYENIENLEKDLERSIQDWRSFDPTMLGTRRPEILASIYILSGKKDKFLASLDLFRNTVSSANAGFYYDQYKAIERILISL